MDLSNNDYSDLMKSITPVVQVNVKYLLIPEYDAIILL